MNLRDYLIGMIIGCIFIWAVVGIIGEMGDDYNISTTDLGNFNSTYTSMNSIKNTSETIESDLQTETIDITSFWGLALAPFKALKLVVSSAGLLKDMIFSFGEEFGIPHWFLWAVGTILILTLCFIVISVIFKRDT